MLALVKGDIALNQCDALLFTRVEDFPARMQDSFDRAIAFRQLLERKENWGPGKLRPQFPPPGTDKSIILHAELGSDPEDMRSLVAVVSKLRVVADKIQSLFDTENVMSSEGNKKRFRSIACPRIGESIGFSWPETQKILKLYHSEPSPPFDQLANAFQVEVYETDLEGVRPER